MLLPVGFPGGFGLLGLDLCGLGRAVSRCCLVWVGVFILLLLIVGVCVGCMG